MNDALTEVEYLSIGGNRQTAAADWHSGGILAFGADCNVALWRPNGRNSRGILSLTGGHQSQVKAVTFLPPASGQSPTLLVTGADDHSLKLWSVDGAYGGLTCLQTVEDHSGAVNCIASLRVIDAASQPRIILVSGAADATLRVYSLETDKLEWRQTIKTNPKYFPLGLALSQLGTDSADGIVLAAGGTRETIQILVARTPGSSIEFTLQATLSGHQGWIRSLDFSPESPEPGSDLLLASASQDKYIRLWRFHRGEALPVAAAAGSDPSLGAFLPGKSLSNKAHRIRAGSSQDFFSVTFEALLLGHEDWVYSARWHHHAAGGQRMLQLLSSSADNSLAVWESDADSGIWITSARLGELSKDKGATTATGSTGGFWTGLWSPDGSSVVCLGRTGSWRRWEYNEAEDRWLQRTAVTGHNKAVTGISWSRDGAYLLSTSSDQTTRLHAEWKNGAEDKRTWHEISRPQIHGYDLNCIDTLGSSMFVSGADEKLMRVFNEPKSVARLVARLTGSTQPTDQVEALPDAADMPVLGLSNKAIDVAGGDEELQAAEDKDPDAAETAHLVREAHALDIDHPPSEDSLSRLTLWPEVEKLYGHGYEISCLAASHDGKLIASACRASSINHAVIRLFETERWTELKPPLTAHSLTATRLRFSPDDRYLLSVGRDRQWAVFERQQPGHGDFELIQANPKGHARMILDAAWAPSSQPRIFATAGRDKQVKLWRAEEQSKAQFALTHSVSLSHPVTALDFLPYCVRPEYTVLAVGTEAGVLELLLISKSSGVPVAPARTVSQNLWLPKAVLQLAWRPEMPDRSREAATLAVAGDDGSLRIYGLGALLSEPPLDDSSELAADASGSNTAPPL